MNESVVNRPETLPAELVQARYSPDAPRFRPVTRASMARAVELALNESPRRLRLTPGQRAWMRRGR